MKGKWEMAEAIKKLPSFGVLLAPTKLGAKWGDGFWPLKTSTYYSVGCPRIRAFGDIPIGPTQERGC